MSTVSKDDDQTVLFLILIFLRVLKKSGGAVLIKKFNGSQAGNLGNIVTLLI